jgi:hypothetical protein
MYDSNNLNDAEFQHPTVHKNSLQNPSHWFLRSMSELSNFFTRFPSTV